MNRAGDASNLQERLDKAAPRFPKRVAQRLNRRAMLFLVAMLASLGLAGMAILRGLGPAPGQMPSVRPQGGGQVNLPKFPGNQMMELAADPANGFDPADATADGAQTATPKSLAAEPRRRPAIVPEEHAPAMYPQTSTMTAAQRLRERRSQRQSNMESMPGDGVDDPAVRIWTEGVKHSARLMAEAGESGGAGSAAKKPAAAERADRVVKARQLPALDQRLLQGTYIRCVLNNRIVTDVPGFAACTVSEPVYSGNGRRLLLPPGTRILGSYSAGDLQYERLAMVWDRIVTPNGVEIDLANPGVDSMGSAGHPGRYTAHWGQRMGAAVMVSLISDAFKYAAEKDGPRRETLFPGTGAVVSQPFESNTAKSLQRLAEQSVAASGRRPPTLTLMAGARLNVYVVKDVDFQDVEAP